MLNFENKCSNCGSTIFKEDIFCRSCGYPFESDEREKEESRLYGIKVTELHDFIDKNSSRYVDIFLKNEGKKIFLNMNWAAMFFNFYWMFYRKMYKYAFIFLLITLVFYSTLTAVAAGAFSPAIRKANEITEPYKEYVYVSGTEAYRTVFSVSDGTVDIEEIDAAISEFNRQIDIISIKLYLSMIIPAVIFAVLFGMLADCIYRRHVLKNIGYKEGGTSFWSAVGGVVVYSIYQNIIATPLITVIITAIMT